MYSADQVEIYVNTIVIPDSKIYSIRINRNAEIPDIVNWINVRSFTFIRTPGSGITTTQVLTYPTFVKDGYLICESPFEQIVKIFDATGRIRIMNTIGIGRKVDIHPLEPGHYIVKGDNFTQKIMIR